MLVIDVSYSMLVIDVSYSMLVIDVSYIDIDYGTLLPNAGVTLSEYYIYVTVFIDSFTHIHSFIHSFITLFIATIRGKHSTLQCAMLPAYSRYSGNF